MAGLSYRLFLFIPKKKLVSKKNKAFDSVKLPATYASSFLYLKKVPVIHQVWIFKKKLVGDFC